MADLTQSLKLESSGDFERVSFSIPEVSLDIEEEENEIRYVQPSCWRQSSNAVHAGKPIPADNI